MTDQNKQRISKVDAAQRQLDSAIELWFQEKDDLSINTLAAAAYQLIHDLKEHRGISRKLLYDASMIKDQYRNDWINLLKKPVNFSKHADKDPEDTLEFNPRGNIGFMVGSAAGLRLLGAQTCPQVNLLILWIVVNKPAWITPNFSKRYEDRLGVEYLENLKSVSKKDFFQHLFSAIQEHRRFAIPHD